VNSLRTYLARNPNASDEGQIKRRIEKLDEQIQAESATAAPPSPGPAQPSGAQQPMMPVGAPPPTGTEAPAAPTGKRSIAPLIVVGVGGVATIVGGIVFFSAASEVSDFELQCPVGADGKRQCPQGTTIAEDANAAQSRQTIGGVVAGVGLAAVAGGLIWYFVSKPSSPAPATALVPAIGPGFGGANLVGSF
jgi:hypothetical protein